MLWRPTYETRILRIASLPPLAGLTLDRQEASTPTEGVLIGAFDPLASGELGVWRRLIEEAFPGHPVPTALIRTEWTELERGKLRLGFPPSHHPRILLANDPTGEWSAIIRPDRPERAFGAIFGAGQAKLLMVGLPTEEAWDIFREEAERSKCPG